MIYINEYESPMGNILLAGDEQGLTGLCFGRFSFPNRSEGFGLERRNDRIKVLLIPVHPRQAKCFPSEIHTHLYKSFFNLPFFTGFKAGRHVCRRGVPIGNFVSQSTFIIRKKRRL